MARFRYIYGEYEDVLLGKHQTACIACNADGKTWRLIRLEEDAVIKVNGEDLHLVHYLSSGDRIDLGGEEETLRFAVRKDGSGDEVRQLRKRIRHIGIFSAAAVAIIFVTIFSILNREDRITREDVRICEESVCKISAVRAMYQQVTVTKDGIIAETLEEKSLDSQAGSGTGFFCEDGRFVTARHCVEPWITESDPLAAYTDDSMVRWAIESETFNASEQSSDSLFRRVITYCEIYSNGEIIHTFSTDTCRFSTENDLVRNLRGRLDPLYWRELGNISRPGSLGDIVMIQTSRKGKIYIADNEMMMNLKAERQIAHLGYEKTQSRMNFESSKLKYDPIKSGDEITRCLEHVSIEMVQGFSGSPALIKEKGKFYAIGVISKTKDSSTSSFFSVPVTELDKTSMRWKD